MNFFRTLAQIMVAADKGTPFNLGWDRLWFIVKDLSI